MFKTLLAVYAGCIMVYVGVITIKHGTKIILDEE